MNASRPSRVEVFATTVDGSYSLACFCGGLRLGCCRGAFSLGKEVGMPLLLLLLLLLLILCVYVCVITTAVLIIDLCNCFVFVFFIVPFSCIFVLL